MLSPAQREAHYTGIGSSTAAAVLGLDPWLTPYRAWLHLTDPSTRPELDHMPHIRLGNLFEPAICQASAEHWKFQIGPPPRDHTYRLAGAPFILCHPDRLVLGENSAVEAKLRGSRMRKAYDDNDGEPLDTELVQAHWQMLAGGFACVYLAVIIDNNTERHWRIERSEVECEYLREQVSNWYRAHVETMTPPPSVTLDDARRKFARATAGKVIEVSGEVAQAIHDYRQAGAALKALKARQDELQLMIIEAAGDADTLVHQGERVATYREQHRQGYTVKETSFRVLRPVN